MKLIDAINLILPKLGEHTVTRVDTKHPSIAIILPEVENTLRQMLLKGWWFNEFEYKGMPDSEGYIFLGQDTLAFEPTDPTQFAVMRGQQLFNPQTVSYKWDRAVPGIVKQYVEFDELPESAAQFVFWAACVNAYATDIGLTQEVQLWQGQAQAAYGDMLAEHIRQRKYSTRQSRRFGRLRRAMRS